MLREYLVWLEEGEDVRAQSYHADISRFLSEQVKKYKLIKNTKNLNRVWFDMPFGSFFRDIFLHTE